MKHYDVVVIGTGSALNIVSSLLSSQPELTFAVIENEAIGRICLTRGCIPSKLLLYHADIVRTIEKSKKFHIDAEIKNVDFRAIMNEMRESISSESSQIEVGLKAHPQIDLYKGIGEFVDEYKMKIGNKVITGDKFIIASGSRPFIPPIKHIEEVGYLTSKTLLNLKELPKSLAIVGGGYIAAEYGHFFSAMGSTVTIVGRNQQFVPSEEPEISELLKRELSEHMQILTGFEVTEVYKKNDKKVVIAKDKQTENTKKVIVDEILIATGRTSNADLLKIEKTGVKTNKKGWILVNEYLETTKPNIWALGDATGKYLFKHVANYESRVVYYNAFTNQKTKVDYHAVPHAVFTYPEVASVGMKQEEAMKGYKVLVGYQRYEETAKGDAMKVKDYFVKVIVERDTMRILGAHIIGPSGSVLIQEVVNLMYTDNQTAMPIFRGMHIHPALSEVVERAFFNLQNPQDMKNKA